MTEKTKRRPKGPPALGDVDDTKIVAHAMIDLEADERRKNSERLRALRLGHSAVQQDLLKEKSYSENGEAF